MSDVREYWVGVDEDNRALQVESHTVGLMLIEFSDVAWFECDIPWASSEDWPEDVARAGRRLSSISVLRRQENDGYHRTGAVRAFSAYAYDGQAWSDRGRLADFSDSGTALTLWLDDAQVDQFRRALPAAKLVRVMTRRERRSARRRLRTST